MARKTTQALRSKWEFHWELPNMVDAPSETRRKAFVPSRDYPTPSDMQSLGCAESANHLGKAYLATEDTFFSWQHIRSTVPTYAKPAPVSWARYLTAFADVGDSLRDLRGDEFAHERLRSDLAFVTLHFPSTLFGGIFVEYISPRSIE